MKTKAIIFSLFCILAAGTVSAQQTDEDRRSDPAERLAKQTERLVTVLELTPEQTDQVKVINESFAKEVQAAREELQAEREAMREKLKGANEKRTSEMEAILTEEQRTKLEALQARRRERMEERRGGRGEGRRGRNRERN